MVDALPVAAAIGTFGVIYGATAATVISPGMTVLSSLLLFSGAAQFSIVGLVDKGVSQAGVVLAVTVLSLRHLPLAAVIRPRLAGSRPRRALLGLVLLDETVGLAVASQRPVAQTLGVVGGFAYAAWVVGTIAGVLGANLMAAAPLASVVFVILFIGLSALTCRSRVDGCRAVVAGLATAVLVVVSPAAGALGGIILALVVAGTAVGSRR